jgi:hypothetical protein
MFNFSEKYNLWCFDSFFTYQNTAKIEQKKVFQKEKEQQQH